MEVFSIVSERSWMRRKKNEVKQDREIIYVFLNSIRLNPHNDKFQQIEGAAATTPSYLQDGTVRVT